MKTYLLCLLLLVVGCETNYYNAEEWSKDHNETVENSDMQKFLTAVTSIVSKTQQSTQQLQTQLPEPGNYTVEFSITNIQPVAPAVTVGNITPVATISWALGGVHYERKISVFNGASITGVAEAVTIRVFDETDLSDTSNQTSYDVSMSVAKGVRGSVIQPPTYQQYLSPIAGGSPLFGSVIIPGGANYTIPVPQNIGINSVMITYATIILPTAGVLENLVSQDSASGTTLKLYNPKDYGFVPINPQIIALTLFNNDTNVGVSYIFNITWGIDG